MSQTPKFEFHELIEQSSLGTEGARRLRSRTPKHQIQLVGYIVRNRDKLTAARKAGDQNGVLDALAGLAAAYQALHRDDEAADLYQEMLMLSHKAGDRDGERHALAGLAATGREGVTERPSAPSLRPAGRPRPVSDTRPEPGPHTAEELVETSHDDPGQLARANYLNYLDSLTVVAAARVRERNDNDDWPSSDWDGVSDEQYWAELAADKPPAAPASSVKSPSLKSSEPASDDDPLTSPSFPRKSGTAQVHRTRSVETAPKQGDTPAPKPVTSSLGEAIQSAYGEGFNFGHTLALDAPALWLEAVLARKPRMPSDLEARLMQSSALSVDALLHDEVRHVLRRGFWDALERARHAPVPEEPDHSGKASHSEESAR